jgi:hypothetical protein
MEHAKSAGSLQSVMVNQKRSVLIEEMEHLLKIWLDDQVQRRIAAKSGHYFTQS